MRPIASGKRLTPFTRGILVAAILGIPLAIGVRAMYRPVHREHSLGGDLELKDALNHTQGAEHVTLLKANIESPDRMRRLAVSEALEDETGPDAAALAERALQDNDSEVRRHAARSLARNPEKASAPLMRALLRDDDLWVRQEALQTVASGVAAPHGPWLAGDLLPLLDDPHPTIRYMAALALRRRTGKPWRVYLRSTPEEVKIVHARWKEWWKSAERSQGTPPPLPAPTALRIDPAPAQTVRTLDGETISPATDGKLTLVHFWGTWCAPCQGEILDLERIHQKHPEIQIVGVALSEPDGEAGLRRYCEERKITFPQALADDAITDAYGGILDIPVTVLVDSKGQVRYRWRGERDYVTFARAIEKLQSE